MSVLNLDISPLPTEFLTLVRDNFSGYIAIHKKEYGSRKSYFIWLNKGDFIGAYPKEFDLLEKLTQLKVITSRKAQTIKASKKRDEPIHQLLCRLDLQLENPTQKILDIVFEEQVNLGKEIFATTEGKATIVPIESENELPHDQLTGQSLRGIKFFLRGMREGEDLIVKSYKSLVPSSIFALRRLPNNSETKDMMDSLNIAEKSILQFSDGVLTIKEIAKRCKLRSIEVKCIFVRLHLLGLVESDVSPSLVDKALATRGYVKNEQEINIQANNNGALVGAGIILFGMLVLNIAGLFQSPELAIFDKFSRWRKIKPSKDITLVTVSDEDINKIASYPLKDEYLATVLENLSSHDPAVIGLDIVRDIPVAPGTERLEKFYQNTDNFIAITKIVPPQIQAPAIPTAKGAIAASDIVLDSDTKVRRHLLGAWDGEQYYNAFGTELASRYFAQETVEAPEVKVLDNLDVQVGETALKPLTLWYSGYRSFDDGGLQILGNYGGQTEDFPQISIVDVYKNRIDPDLIKGKIIIIGATADSLKDLFSTPLSKYKGGHRPTPGMVIHANLASSLIQGAKGELNMLRPLNIFSELGLIGLAFTVGIGGGLVILWYQFNEFSMPSWVITVGVCSGLIIGTIRGGFYLFTGGLWIPVFSLSFASMAGLLYSSAQFQNFSKKILYTNNVTGAKNRKYLTNLLNVKHKYISSYSLVGIYLNLSELNLNRETKNTTSKEIYNNLRKFITTDCQITQLSTNCYVVVLDSVAPDIVGKVETQIDKIMTGLNITDEDQVLSFNIASINNVSLQANSPEESLNPLLKKLN